MTLVEFVYKLIFIVCLISLSAFSLSINEVDKNVDESGNVGEPLMLTPLIKQGKIKEAQTAAEVKFDGFKHIKSYSGFFTVSETFNSNLYFWFFPAAINYTTAPIVLWLQGGPGVTSMMGIFLEHGPFILKPKHGLKLRKNAWTETHSVIYIDNPVGAGFSFTDNGGYAQNITIIGDQLYSAMTQFFQLFPDLQQNDFFVTGESFAGKYVPALSYAIHKNNPTSNLKINLKGFATGNGFSDPVNQIQYSDYLYQLGLVDTDLKVKLHDLEQQMIYYIHNEKWLEATKIFKDIFISNETFTCFFEEMTGLKNHYNYLVSTNLLELGGMSIYLQRQDVRRAIHVGNATFIPDNQEVLENLSYDFMKSVAPWISELLSNYRALIYNGQLDVIVGYPLTENFLKMLKFDGAEEYKTAKRHKWYVEGTLAGYVKQAGNLTELMVRNAGHIVPGDQPFWALDMINRFTENKPFY